MKRIISILFSVTLILALAGCSSNTSTTQSNVKKETTTQVNNKPKAKELTQEELNEKLKSEATKADFVQINGYEDNFKGKKLYAEGKISAVDYDKVMDLFPSFTLYQQEGSGVGMYHITNVLSTPDLKSGDTVKIYGTIDGNDNSGMPKINETVIEKIK